MCVSKITARPRDVSKQIACQVRWENKIITNSLTQDNLPKVPIDQCPVDIGFAPIKEWGCMSGRKNVAHQRLSKNGKAKKEQAELPHPGSSSAARHRFLPWQVCFLSSIKPSIQVWFENKHFDKHLNIFCQSRKKGYHWRRVNVFGRQVLHYKRHACGQAWQDMVSGRPAAV